MTDQQIVPGAGPTPVAITLDVAQRLLPKIAFASFDGTGAAGDFLPVVKFVGPGGLVAGQAVGDVVAAGASADQTWFRGLAKQAKASAGLSWCSGLCGQTTHPLAPGLTGDRTASAAFATNDSSAFSVNGIGNIEVDKAGTYQIMGGFYVQNLGAPVANPWSTHVDGGPGNFPGSTIFGPGLSAVAVGSAGQVWNGTWTTQVHVSSSQTGSSIDWNWNNATGVSLHVSQAGVFLLRVSD